MSGRDRTVTRGEGGDITGGGPSEVGDDDDDSDGGGRDRTVTRGEGGDITGGGPSEVDDEPGRTIRTRSEEFTAGEIIEMTSPDEDTSIQVETRGQQLAALEAAADRADEVTAFDVERSDVQVNPQEGTFRLTGEARERARRNQAAENFASETPLKDVPKDDIALTDDGARLTGESREQLIRRELETQLGRQQLRDVDPGIAARASDEQLREAAGPLEPGRDFRVDGQGSQVDVGLTDEFIREQARSDVERQIETETGLEVDPGEDFELEQTGGGQFDVEFSGGFERRLLADRFNRRLEGGGLGDVSTVLTTGVTATGAAPELLGAGRDGPRVDISDSAAAQRGALPGPTRRGTTGDIAEGELRDAADVLARSGQNVVETGGDIAGRTVEEPFAFGAAAEGALDDEQTIQGSLTREPETPTGDAAGRLLGEGPLLGTVGAASSVPSAAFTLADVGTEAAQFTRERVEEEGPVQGLQESGAAAAGAGETFAKATAEQIVGNPLRTTGALAGSSLTFGLSRAVGPRTNLATRAAIQPGEEALGIGGNRLLSAAPGSVTSRAADRLFPQNEPLIFSEEAAILTARRAGETGARAVRGARDLVRGDIELSPSPRQRDLIEEGRLGAISGDTELRSGEFVGETDQAAGVSEPLGSDVEGTLDALEGTPESGQPFETTGTETSGRDESNTGRDRPPLREDIREEGGLGFFVRGGDPPEGRTIPFEETRENFRDLLDDERAQLGAGRQRRRQDPDRPAEFTEFDAEAERRQELAQRREVASDIDRRRPAREPARAARQRSERAQRPFTETASETDRPRFRSQPGLLEGTGPGGAVDLGVEFGERLASRPGQRPGIDSRVRPAVDTDTRVDLGVRAALETGTDVRSDLRADVLTDTELETELETETETESEFERELETEQFFELETESEIELETERESEAEFEGFPGSPEFGETNLFGSGAADDTFSSGIQSADDILDDR